MWPQGTDMVPGQVRVLGLSLCSIILYPLLVACVHMMCIMYNVCVVNQWGVEEVACWLEQLCLSEYKEIFIRHDVRGPELVHLERRDLKVTVCVCVVHSRFSSVFSLCVLCRSQDLGVTKVGHMKRILQGIRDLNRNSTASEA